MEKNKYNKKESPAELLLPLQTEPPPPSHYRIAVVSSSIMQIAGAGLGSESMAAFPLSQGCISCIA